MLRIVLEVRGGTHELHSQRVGQRQADHRGGTLHQKLQRGVPDDGGTNQGDHTQQRYGNRQPAVETTRLGVGPFIHFTGELAAVRGDGAAVLDRAGVAHAGLGAVTHHSVIRVECGRPQPLVFGAEPRVALFVVGEPEGSRRHHALAGALGENIEAPTHGDQAERVHAGQPHEERNSSNLLRHG